MEKVAKYYDEQYDEWTRLERHKIEFDITKKYLDEYIVGESLEIFDIGGGPGRYAICLAEKGHRVSLLDLSKRNIEVAKAECAKRGVRLEQYIHGNALELDDHERKYDVVLLMGPLYHLIDESHRRKAVEGALRLLKPNGLLIISFISNYAPIQDNLKYFYPIDSVDDLLGYLQCGVSDGSQGFTTAYFTGPQEARGFMHSFGLSELVFAGVENILNSKEQEINLLDDEEYEKWLEICYQLGRDPNLFGVSEHYLYIGQK